MSLATLILIAASSLSQDSEQSVAADANTHWAFRPLSVSTRYLPSISDSTKPQLATPIDLFVLERLQEAGLPFSIMAPKSILLRRIKLDLTGLPVTADELDSILADTRPDALDRRTDELLASPHYGERWGRYWLDVARFADTKGYIYGDREERRFIHSHVYRDWVIGALNEDLPYDQFLLHQLAADKLSDQIPKTSLAAMGFLTLGRRFAGNFYEIIDDRIDTLCRATMGLSVSCARCHDHKYDPVSQADYYSLYGILSGSFDATTSFDTSVLSSTEQNRAERRAWEEELQRRQQSFDDGLRTKSDETLNRVRARSSEYLMAVLDVESLPTENEYRILDANDLNPVYVRQWHSFLLSQRSESHPILMPMISRHVLAGNVIAGHDMAGHETAKHVPEQESFSQSFSQWLSDHQNSLNGRIASALSSPVPSSRREVARRIGTVLEQVHRAWRSQLDEARRQNAEPPSRMPNDLDESVRQLLYGVGSPIGIPAGPINEVEWCFDEPTRVQLGSLQMKIDQWILQSSSAPKHAVHLVDRPQQRAAHVFVSGNPAIKGEFAPRRLPAIIAQGANRSIELGSGRWELAQAIISPQNPLTARVLVNRVWLNHFGAGLVDTPSDFGTLCRLPSHPELLDWLAQRFVADRFSLKRLHRLILSSHVYLQNSDTLSSARQMDPDNRLLSHMNRRRLDYEALRDSLLAVSGSLDTRVGGPSESVTDGTPGNRRGVYSFVDRLNFPNVARVFNVANPDVHSPQRHQTTVPQQALYLLNSPFLIERARKLAERTDSIATRTGENRIQVLYRLALARTPTDREMELGARMSNSPILEPVVVPAPIWLYGWGEFDRDNGTVRAFRRFATFTGIEWRSELVDARSVTGSLSSVGGQAAENRRLAVIRRWVSPFEGTVVVTGKLEHKSEVGDGVQAFLVSSRLGELASFQARQSNVEATLRRVSVQPGDLLDFLVFCRNDAKGDEFQWSPIIRLETKKQVTSATDDEVREWNSARDFSGPQPTPLTPWEKYVQVLLLTNEFAFVD